MQSIAEKLGIEAVNAGASTGSLWMEGEGSLLESVSPIDGRVIAAVRQATAEQYERVIEQARAAFAEWRMVPAPKRGEIVRQIGEAIRRHKAQLGALVTLEMGKIRAEGEGEVQEMIDICDFAVGQSRMLYGMTMPSERPRHRMYEQWHPLGPVGVITSFNFPVAVPAWNAMIALVAGDTVVWKPSHKVPLCAIAVTRLIAGVLEGNGLPEGIFNLLIGGRREIGARLIQDPRLPLISATGSVPMGRRVGQTVAKRLGRSILELGGNNGIVVTPSADLELAVRAVLFGAVGTAGQRCTTTRRLIVHREIFDPLLGALIKAYRQVRIGNPLEEGVIMGPLIDRAAVAAMQKTLETLENQGGKVLWGGEVLTGGLFDAGTYVTPCLAEASGDCAVVREETFAPILYLLPYDTLNEAIALHNAVPQGLSSAIFTAELREAEAFLGAAGSDREAGSDAWKGYMRRQTNTINWSDDLPLAQGIRFGRK